jgi:outer membrane protein TolC
VPKDAAVQRSDLNGPLRQDADSVVSAPVPEDWWQLYQDQRLNELVRQALSANTELRVAAANIAKARAQVEVAESQGGFNGGVKLGAQRLQESGEAFLLPEKVPVANIGEAIISASYQFDLWGTFKRGTEAAKANADAVQAAADTARITLVADVVKAYTQVCSANEEYHIARESLDLQEQSVTLNQRLRDAGRGDETQVTRSQTQFKSLRAELPRFKAERETGMYTLAGAAGQTGRPAACRHRRLCRTAAPEPAGSGGRWRRVAQAPPRRAPGRAPAGCRHRLHRRGHGRTVPGHQHRRPGGHHRYPGKPRRASTNRWGFGPQISWSIPTNGTRAHSHGRSLDPGGLGELRWGGAQRHPRTQTRLAQYSALLDRRDALAEAEKSAKEAADQTHRYYQAGRESFLADLQATRTYTDMRAQLAAANSQVAMGQIGVFLALGGGWKDTAKH